MVRYNYRRIPVKTHTRTYYVNDGNGGYKSVEKRIASHTRRIKTGMTITQPAKVKNKVPYIARTMTKEIPPNLIEGVQKLAKDQEYEYSIDIDFERKEETPQQMLVMRGGKRETTKIGDFELFGHTHPHEAYPYPSNIDLQNLAPLKPEFIIAQKTGKAILINIEDYKKWFNWKYYGPKVDTRIIEFEQGRKKIFNKTGVMIYPMMKNIKIEMKDDPHYEKHFPRTSKDYLKKWHSG